MAEGVVNVYVIVAGYHYNSNWVVGVEPSMDSAKRLAEEEYGPITWVTNTDPYPAADGQWSIRTKDRCSSTEYRIADEVVITEWKVEP